MERQYVGIDLHRRRSVIYQMDEGGEKLSCVRVDNDPWRFAEAVSRAPEGTDVVIEATYGWYWAADLLADLGYVVHSADPQAQRDRGHRRVKNDERRRTGSGRSSALGSPGRGLDAPPATRELREMVRFRFKLSNLRTGIKAQAHAVMAKNGVLPCRNDMWGVGGAAQLDSLELPDAYLNRLGVLRDLVEVYDREISSLDRDTHLAFRDHPGYNAVQAIYGVRRVFAAVFVAEVGDVQRFSSPQALGCLGGAHPHPPGVRHQGAPRAHHQAGLSACALDGHRGRGPLQRRCRLQGQLRGDRRTPWPHEGQRGHRPQSPHARLLRPS